jgi:hypothetical protein
MEIKNSVFFHIKFVKEMKKSKNLAKCYLFHNNISLFFKLEKRVLFFAYGIVFVCIKSNKMYQTLVFLAPLSKIRNVE